MKYIKKFDRHAEYEDYVDSQDYITPNVSYCVLENEVHFNKYTPPYDPFNGHEYVDLGLPSGTLWAKYNVGAETESDYGQFFSWGDTQGYTVDQVETGEGQKPFTWNDYKFGHYSALTKYNESDGKTVLDLEDDAARSNMGGEWRMPSSEQISELLELPLEIVNKNGVKGMEFTGTNDNTIFFPFAGDAVNGFQMDSGYSTSILSLYLNTNNPNMMYYMYLTEDEDADIQINDRCYGRCVRGVIN